MKIETFNRLSEFIVPSHYCLTITPNLESMTFIGSVIIHLQILKETNLVELHCLGLNLNEIKFTSDEGSSYSVENFEFSKVNESVRIYFLEPIQCGHGKLSLVFDGSINDGSSGFYRTKCTDRNGLVTFAALTQFEPAYARKAFPCFDEPSIKATFDVTIIADKTKTVLSNMPIKNVSDFESDSKLARFSFQTSPKMSTYLVAYLVGDYDFVEEMSKLGVLVRIYTPVGQTELGNFSMQVSLKALEFFTNFFGIKYPLPKLDLIAVKDIEFDAMENFGLLTFKESLLLLDTDNFTVKARSQVALTVCHEIAHQWFGNLVTMKWWTDLWLNEGFATWIEYLAVNDIFPDWNIWNLYATDHLYRANNLDCLASSHPIEVPIQSPDQITQIFDSISYCKGSSVIRMLNNYVGNDVFKKGLQTYLNKFLYNNADSENLWSEIDAAAAGKNVKSLMHIWTREKNFPLVKVSKKVNSQKRTILQLEQSRFLIYPGDDQKLADLVWSIPIFVTTKSSYPKTQTKILMNTKSVEIDLGELSENEWVLINQDNNGIFRTLYPAELFDNLIQSLNESQPLGSVLDRYCLLMDSFTLARSAHMSAYDLMRLVWQFRHETDMYVWTVLAENLNYLLRTLKHTHLNAQMNNFIAKFLDIIKSKIGFDFKDGEDDSTRSIREEILYLLAKIDDGEFKTLARKKYDNRHAEKIQADLQKPIFASVIQNGSTNEVDEMMNIYKNCRTPEEREKIVTLLGEANDSKAVDNILNISISSDVTHEESIFIIKSIAQNSSSRESTLKAWNFIKSNWGLFSSRYSGSLMLGRFLKPVLENFTSTDMLNDIENFFDRNKTAEAEFAIKQAMEIVKSNVFFLENQLKEFERFFSTHQF